MSSTSLLIRNIGKLLLASESRIPYKKGIELSTIPAIDSAFLLIENARISSFGPDLNAPQFNGPVIDARQGFVLPAFIDCHTHLVFADWRETEFSDRLKGLSYQEIAARGGGILNSAKKLAALPEDQLYERSAQRLQDAIRSGTGAMEIKSGYGLNTEQELKILRVIRRLKDNFPIPIKATFLGAHAFPIEFRQDHKGYIDRIVHEMLPEIAKDKLADYCDVFCEHNFFNVEETELILQSAAQYGLKARIHTNQFTHSGGIPVAIRNHALSVDHLEVCSDEEISLLKNSSVLPVLLPSAAFFMNQHYPPARKMIDQGLGVILASDFNPGTSPSYNLAFVLSLACIQMKMTPEEALQALTINPAYTLQLDNELGSIEPGKMANIIITEPCTSLAFLPYFFGSSWISKVIISGNPDF